MAEPGDGCTAPENDTSLTGKNVSQVGEDMNILINNPAVRALAGASALGLAAAAGFVGGRSADATPTQARSPSFVEHASVPAPQFMYYVVDSRQAALDIERAEYV